MSQETPADRSPPENGWWFAQTDRQALERPPEKEQKPSDHTPDLEKWQETHTH
jgi:hypothetical protein